MKVAIIGYSGSGKSTLARWYAEKLGVPVLHLDAVHFSTGWVKRSDEDMRADVAAFLDGNTGGWVIDGTYKKCAFERRMEECDQIVFLRFNRFVCFFRAWKRYRYYKGKSRFSMAEGCDEKFDFTFIKWLLVDGRVKRRRLAFEKVTEKYREKTVVLKNQRELTAFMRTTEKQV